MQGLATVWIYGVMPAWFLVALVWMLFGSLDIVKGIFAQVDRKSVV